MPLGLLFQDTAAQDLFHRHYDWVDSTRLSWDLFVFLLLSHVLGIIKFESGGLIFIFIFFVIVLLH